LLDSTPSCRAGHGSGIEGAPRGLEDQACACQGCRSMTQDDTDQQLVQRVQKGDKSAFDLLVLKYQHRVLKLVSRFVSDTAEAQDVAQEAFLKAYRALPSF